MKEQVAIPLKLVSSHRRKRSQYYEAEIHSSEATIQSDELPSARIINTSAALELRGRRSYLENGNISPDRAKNYLKSKGGPDGNVDNPFAHSVKEPELHLEN